MNKYVCVTQNMSYLFFSRIFPVGKISCLCNKRFDQQVATTPQDSIKRTEEEEEGGQPALKHSG